MNRIREIRQAKGIRQTDLANILGVSQSTLSTWENGRYEPDFSSLNKLADYFQVPVDHILGREADVQFALYGDKEIDGDVYDEIAAFAKYAKNRKKKAPSKDEAELQEFMQLYEQLSPEHRSVLLAAAKGFAQEK